MGFFEIFGAALAGIYSVVHSYGLAIIGLTLLTRIIMLPLSIKQTRSMREMQRVQPEVKKIQAKYKGDKQKMNQEMMALYKEHGVNPFGGCLPLLMQFPVLIALFRVLRNPLSYMGAGTALYAALKTNTLAVHQFLGIRLDCTAQKTLQHLAPDTIPGTQATGVCGTTIWAALPYLFLVLLMGASTWYQQRQMQASTATPDGKQAQQMQTFAKIMPAMLMFFAFTFPSGLVLYWLTTNFWTIGQQRIMLAKAPPVITPGAANGKGEAPAKQLKKPDIPTTATKKPSPNGGAKKGSQNGAARQKQTAAASKPNPNAKKKKKR